MFCMVENSIGSSHRETFAAHMLRSAGTVLARDGDRQRS